MEHLTAKDWGDFEKNHRDAFYFLLHRSLARERIALLSIKPERLNDWQRRRLEELNTLNETTGHGLSNF